MWHVGEKYKLKDIFDKNLTEIYKGSKSGHLREISKKSGCSLEEMVFFDNEWGNCQTVAKIGVTVVYTPKGVTRHLFQEALDQFPAPGHIIGKRKSWVKYNHDFCLSKAVELLLLFRCAEVRQKDDIQTFYNFQSSEIYQSFSFDLIFQFICMLFPLIIKGDAPGCIIFNSQGILLNDGA